MSDSYTAMKTSKMASKRPQIGDLIHVVFWDHAENFHDAIRFEVVGKITSITRRAYVVHTWMYSDPIDRAKDTNLDANENCFCIVKRAIDSIRILK